MDSTQILLIPVQTEKAVRAAADQRHTFFVADKANKLQIVQAIRELYGVTPKHVRISRLPQKKTSQGRSKRRFMRKAMITLSKGDTIDPIKLKK